MDLNIHIGASDTLVVAFGFWPKILGGSRDLRISCYFVTMTAGWVMGTLGEGGTF